MNVPKDEFKEEIDQQPDRTEKKIERIDKKIVNVNKNEAYLEFKGTVGQDINNSIVKNNVRLVTHLG